MIGFLFVVSDLMSGARHPVEALFLTPSHIQITIPPLACEFAE